MFEELVSEVEEFLPAAETVENRIAVYIEQTMPLVDYYTAAGNIAVIDGALALDTVFDAIVEAIGE